MQSTCGKCVSNIHTAENSAMADKTTADFDFDDWAGLYIENPEEFEARRKAVLYLAMARGTPDQSAAGRVLLESYEKQVKGQDVQTRLKIASSFMMDSLQQLQSELMLLQHTIEGNEDQPYTPSADVQRKDEV
jgi:hypothetical protein